MALYSSWIEDAKFDVEDTVASAMLDSMFSKIEPYNAEYISPQELVAYLPQSLKINRYHHIFKHQSGAWEIRNKNIRCFVGFQVQTDDPATKSLIRSTIRKNSARRRHRAINKSQNNDGNLCNICYKSWDIKHPGFNKHICRVIGHFKCYTRRCKGRTFRVGICLLDPDKEAPPTGYQCAKCLYDAEFVDYEIYDGDMNKNDTNGYGDKEHRSDLCEACRIWGDCQKVTMQPSAFTEGLWYEYGAEIFWEWNEYDDGIYASFQLLNDDFDPVYDHPDDEFIQYEFEIVPYVKCMFVKMDAVTYNKPRAKQQVRRNQFVKQRRDNTNSNKHKKGNAKKKRNINTQQRNRANFKAPKQTQTARNIAPKRGKKQRPKAKKQRQK